MKEIYAATAIVAQLLVLGIEKVTYRHIQEVARGMYEFIPKEYYIDSRYVKLDNGFCYQPNQLEREEVNNIFVRGWCNKSQAEILNVFKKLLLNFPCCEELIDKLNGIDLVAIYHQVFTQEYIEKHYFWEIPEEYRQAFVQICREYVELELKLAAATAS